MQVNEETIDGVLVVSPAGRLDSNTSPEFEAHLFQRMEEHPSLVIRFGDVDYISSAGLRVMLMTAKKIKQNGGRLVLCEIGDPIREVFEISGFLTILEVCDDPRGAVERVNA
ncbi:MULTISPECIES: STAS domain-containing protein [unclassified Thioalkalivibrio]|uniref:STAS domain-containing protein n=1 Tax=unclassified Thioalkalivibrio TaxID=2621013 RepID=UPI000376F2E5|nr:MULTISPECIES: STAS domain-containing protein [unclassified Thioalkalivibrio]